MNNKQIAIIVAVVVVIIACAAAAVVLSDDDKDDSAATYTITFDSTGGGDVASQTVESGKTTSEPTAPVKTGYKFIGWFTDQDLKNDFSFSTKITSDLTLYAKWMTTDASTASEAVTAFTTSYSGHYGSTIAVDEGATADSARAIVYSRGMDDTEHDTVPYYIDFTRADDAASQYATLKETLDNGTYNFMTSKVRQLSIVGYDNVDAWVADVEFVLGDQHYNFTYIYLVAYHDDLLVSIMGFDEKTGKFSMSKGLCSFGSVATDEDNAKFINVILGSIGVTEQISIPTYTVTFESNGGSDVTVQTVGANATVSKPTDPVRDGYVFIAWYSDSSLTQQYDFSAQVTADLTLYAKWVASDARFTINYDSQGGSSVASQTVMAGRYASKPTDPTRDGYTFNGWYTDAGCTASFSFNTRIYEDTMLYAGWISNANSGAIAAAKEFIDNYDGKYTGYSASGGNVEGYSLGNGSDERSATAVTYNLGMSDLNNATTAYAISYTVYDDAASATARYEKIASDAGRSRSDGGLYEFMGSTLSQINLTGYSQVSAWKNDVTNPVIFTMCYVVACHDNIVVTTMMYKDDSESAMSPYGSVEYGQTSTVAWDLEFINAILTSIGADKVTSPDLTTYTLTFESNGGSAVESQTVNVGEIPTKPTDPTREGYLFGGWYTDKDLTQQYNFSSTITSDTILYAKWVVSAQRTVTFSNATVSANGSALTTGAKVADSTRLTIKPDTAPSGTVPTVMVNGKPVDARFGSYSYTVLGDDVKIDVTYYEKYTAKMCGDNAYWVFDPETGNLTIAGSGRMDDFTGGDIWAGTIYNGNTVTSIAVDDGITYVGGYAFAGDGVVSITIGKDVSQFGDRAFSSAIKDIKLSESNTALTIIGGALYDSSVTTLIACPTSVTSIIIPDSVTNMSGVFAGNRSIESVTIGKGLKAIGQSEFNNCTSLKTLVLGESVTTIGEYAFRYTAIESIIIPDSVTDLGMYVFQGCNSLATAVIGNGITKLNGSLFDGCSALTTVSISDSVTTVETYAFRGCISLKSVDFGTKVAEGLNRTTFIGCSSLESINIKEGNPTYYSLDGVLFSTDGTLIQYPVAKAGTSYTVGGSVKSIGVEAFSGNKYLTEVTIEDSVTSLGGWAFMGSASLEKVTIGKGITAIPQYLFSNCKALKEVSFGNITSIGDNAFSGSGIESITIPEGVTQIDLMAFAMCRSLTSVTLPSTLKTIGESAFSDCSALTALTIPSTVESIAGAAFRGCTSLTSVVLPTTVKTIDDSVFAYLKFYEGGNLIYDYWTDGVNKVSVLLGKTFVGDGKGTLVVPDGRIVTFTNATVSADGSVIESGTKITDGTVITIVPATGDEGTVATIMANGNPVEPVDSVYSYMVFKDDVTITVTYAPFVTAGYCGSKGDNLTWKFDTDTLTLTITGTGAMRDYTASPWAAIKNEGKNAVENIVIGDGVTSIGSYAFSDPTSWSGCAAKSVKLPDSVKTIGNYAFAFCSSLSEIDLGKVTSIGSSAFMMTSIKNIAIPDTLTTVENYAFAYMTSLESVVLPASVKTVGEGLFTSDRKLVSATLPSGLTEIPVSMFEKCAALASIEIPATVTSIGDKAFESCSALTSVIIPDSVTVIGVDAFHYAGLTSLVLGKSVKTIGEEAFLGTSLTSLVIPDSVTEIGPLAFYIIKSLKTVEFGKSVTTIGERAFSMCESLTSLVIPDSVTTIGQGAFSYCTALTSVTVPGTVTSLGNSAFGEAKFYDTDGTTELALKDLPGYTYTGADQKFTRVANQA